MNGGQIQICITLGENEGIVIPIANAENLHGTRVPCYPLAWLSRLMEIRR